MSQAKLIDRLSSFSIFDSLVFVMTVNLWFFDPNYYNSKVYFFFPSNGVFFGQHFSPFYNFAMDAIFGSN